MKNSNVVVGSHIQWTSEDNDGQYSYKGVVSQLNEKDNSISFQTESGGEFTVMNDDGNIQIIEDSGVELKVKEEETVKKVRKPKTTNKVAEKKTVTKSNGESKVQKAMLIFNEHYGKLSRKDIIQMFKDQLDMSDAGGSTYYQNCKKKSTQS